ncbi:hypothetical protein QWI17_13015 [Gilvimarinus sp. SDUM040013]|uniref:Tetratricopeptide repeat protein n=1 Tax=Gilvimarinus gilvus TaxID=3058038 RepID=A0ABU4RTU7_9GAMM|nr:tetratricopeptide repeat protein [Gilvimarinus sp. SDUM040013]MDO3386760.1 hypothetical protein [Gilvimarinus sp. SDUM040013]MDX6848310.1 hypothetical protein [Gilvimarinus sp. SDUM040013]
MKFLRFATVIFTIASLHWPASVSALDKAPSLFAGQIAPLLEGMGQHEFAIDTEQPMAQAYFNQAVALTYGFNHLEAGRSFRQVAELEPNLPMAYWGQALVLGPNINGAMEADSVAPALAAIESAMERLEYASAKERDLIMALASRYSSDETMADRQTLDAAYADAMLKVATKYPSDPNVMTLLAESLMVIHAWDYWHSDGRPKEWTPQILEILTQGLSEHPRHAGLIHYYIHAVEASKSPEAAEAYADTLRDLVPGAGHLVHMPSHIYLRVGRYQDGVIANEKAMQVDDNYIAQCKAQGVYPVAYVPHNRHFLWAMATMQGSSAKAISAAEHMASHIDTELMLEPGLGTLQHYWVTPLYAYVRFGQWQKIFAAQKPNLDLKYPLGIWHYARGVAFVASNQLDRARLELSVLQTLAADDDLKDVTVWDINDAQSIVSIAALVLEGEIEGKAGHYARSIEMFEAAIAMEDALNYDEPSDWHYPVRQSLGAVLIDAGDYQRAAAVYRQDLQTFPNNGWSLLGLYQALQKQGAEKEAAQVKAKFDASWQWADITIRQSRIL